MALSGKKQSPHILEGEVQEDMSCSQLVEGCCATPLIPENDVILLKVAVPPTPLPPLFHNHIHISADLLMVEECVSRK